MAIQIIYRSPPVDRDPFSELAAELRERRARIVERFEQRRRQSEEREFEPMDACDLGTLEEGESFTELLCRIDLRMVNSIELALARMENGDYGLCAACEEEIDIRRLRARPEAQLCIDCTQVAERSQPPIAP